MNTWLIRNKCREVFDSRPRGQGLERTRSPTFCLSPSADREGRIQSPPAGRFSAGALVLVRILHSNPTIGDGRVDLITVFVKREMGQVGGCLGEGRPSYLAAALRSVLVLWCLAICQVVQRYGIPKVK